MEIEYELNEEDYINYNIYHSGRSPAMKKNIRRQRILGPVVFMLAPFVLKRISKLPFWYWTLCFFIASLIWFIFYPRYARWEIRRNVRSMMKEGDNENLYRRRRLKIGEDGLEMDDSIDRTKLSWEKIVAIEESEDYIYVYISSVSAFLIPKRVFKDLDQLSEFQGELEKHYREYKRI